MDVKFLRFVVGLFVSAGWIAGGLAFLDRIYPPAVDALFNDPITSLSRVVVLIMAGAVLRFVWRRAPGLLAGLKRISSPRKSRVGLSEAK